MSRQLLHRVHEKTTAVFCVHEKTNLNNDIVDGWRIDRPVTRFGNVPLQLPVLQTAEELAQVMILAEVVKDWPGHWTVKTV